MVQEFLIRLLLSPVSLLYGLGVSLRNLTYRLGMVRPVRFDLPVISVGNLSVGGTGKTPHIEYLIVLFREYLELAVLSRGYLRKTRGFHYVTQRSTANDVGDEPLQFKLKYPEITVAVSESRSLAIPQMVMNQPGLQLILLDDAFQHRSVEPAMHIMLTEHDRLFTRDYLLPSGRLREWRSAYLRAHRIIVTKCPDDLSREQAEQIRREIDPAPYQQVYFSRFRYGTPYRLFQPVQRQPLTPDIHVLLISAIARTDYLLDYLNSKVNSVKVLEYEDHHLFDKFDMANLKARFEDMESEKKIILTTEKDAMRLELHKKFIIDSKLPVLVLPTQVKFHDEDGDRFDEQVREYIKNFTL